MFPQVFAPVFPRVLPFGFYRLFLTLIVLGSGLVAPAFAVEPKSAAAPDFNAAILAALRSMPNGGRYSATSAASRNLEASMSVTARSLNVEPQRAMPSYCSGATYLVFLETIEQLTRSGALQLEPAVLNALLVRGQRDGHGVWGRWNANGPGTARLFRELDLGRNFTSYAEARPGDFLKIFWSAEIGMRERGHSVIYLGSQTIEGIEYVRFWSSNQPLGYGEKSVPKSKIAQALFSRLEKPDNLTRLGSLAGADPYLASLLSARSSASEMKEKCGY